MQVKEVRELLLTVVGDKHQPQAAKFGAVLALGILDAGTLYLLLTFHSFHS